MCACRCVRVYVRTHAKRGSTCKRVDAEPCVRAWGAARLGEHVRSECVFGCNGEQRGRGR